MNENEEVPDDLDETDVRLLEVIDEDFDISLGELSDELELSKSAIHYRLRKLKDAGVVEGITADINPTALGLTMTSITQVSVKHETGYARDIGQQLSMIHGVDQVFYTMGDVDFVVISRVQNRDQLNELIDAMVDIDGVNETSSRFVMREIDAGEGSLPMLTEKMRSNITDEP